MARLPSKLLQHVLIAALVILCMATPSCKAQDAVQIVARAALCFDNHTVINRCLQQMGISTNATAAPGSGFFDKLPTSPNAGAVLCGTPCFGHMMLMTNCVDGILSNFQGYSSGLMQGVRAIFQMSCGGAGSGGDAEGDGPPAAHGGNAGALKGGSNAASGEVAQNVNGGAASASAAVPAANGAAAAGGLGHVGDLVWVGIVILVAAQYGAI